MNDIAEYCKEMTIYHMTDYDFLKESLTRCEEIESMMIQILETRVNNLKKLIPGDCKKTGKVIRLKIAN